MRHLEFLIKMIYFLHKIFSFCSTFPPTSTTNSISTELIEIGAHRIESDDREEQISGFTMARSNNCLITFLFSKWNIRASWVQSKIYVLQFVAMETHLHASVACVSTDPNSRGFLLAPRSAYLGLYPLSSPSYLYLFFCCIYKLPL